MDPPAFGHTPAGRIWRLGDHRAGLLADVVSTLADPVFLLINDYSRDAEHERIASLVESALKMYAPGRIESGHLRLQRTADHHALDTGVFVRWHR